GGSDKISTEQVADLQVFPNPATTHIGVKHEGEVTMIKVFNLVGRHMKTFTTSPGEKHFVGDLPRGMYLIQLVNNRNKIITTKRVNKR
ncbi:MAG: T9SS type A sorting domain-containing protein, partial [Saprospiraceae bacterium]